MPSAIAEFATLVDTTSMLQYTASSTALASAGLHADAALSGLDDAANRKRTPLSSTSQGGVASPGVRVFSPRAVS